MKKINELNYFNCTKAHFTKCKMPKRTPDFVSESGSEYWYFGNGVVRNSDHWSLISQRLNTICGENISKYAPIEEISSCFWTINNIDFSEWQAMVDVDKLRGKMDEKKEHIKNRAKSYDDDNYFYSPKMYINSVKFKFTKTGKINPTKLIYISEEKFKYPQATCGYCLYKNFKSIKNQTKCGYLASEFYAEYACDKEKNEYKILSADYEHDYILYLRDEITISV